MAIKGNTNALMALVVERLAESLNMRAPATMLARIVRLRDGERYRSPIPPRRGTGNQAAGGQLTASTNQEIRAVTLDPSEDTTGDWIRTNPLNISHAELVRVSQGGVGTVMEEFADSLVQLVDARLMALNSQAGSFVGGGATASDVLTVGNVDDVPSVLAVRQAFRRAGISMRGTDARPSMIINDASYEALAANDNVLRADSRGTDATIRTGFLEDLAGFRYIMDTDASDTASVSAVTGNQRSVNQASAPAGYPVGYQGQIAFDGSGATAPPVGSAVRFGTSQRAYIVQSATASAITLTMPLLEEVGDNAHLNFPSAHRRGLAARPGAIVLAYRELPTGQLDNGFAVMSTHPTGINVRMVRVGTGLASVYVVDLLYSVAVVQPRGVVAIGLAA